jgi:DNA-binding MarR family transcriptional regulator
MIEPHDTDVTSAALLAADFRSLVGKLKRRLREQTISGTLTPAQVSVLMRLEKEGAATISGLAREEGMRPQSMSAVVKTLQTAGLVLGSPDPDDRRQIKFAVTDTHRRKLREDRPARRDWLTRAIQARLSAPEQKKVAAALELLNRLLDE